MKEWLSIKEASDIFQKHPDTIRGLIKKNPESVMRDEHGKLFVKSDLLKRSFPATEESEARTNQGDTILEALLAELKQKNDEISHLHKIIEEMSSQQAKLVDQQQNLSAFLLKASNTEEEEEEGGERKKHWWNRK